MGGWRGGLQWGNTGLGPGPCLLADGLPMTAGKKAYSSKPWQAGMDVTCRELSVPRSKTPPQTQVAGATKGDTF